MPARRGSLCFAGCGYAALWSLDIWEGFFKLTRAGRPQSYVRCGPKGLGNFARAFSLGRFHPHDGKPCRGGGMPPYRLIPNITFVEIQVMPM